MKLRMPSDDGIKADLAEIGRKAPFAAAAGLNILANRAQAAMRDHVRSGKDFMLRRSTFVLNTIKREKGQDFASHRSLVASVRIDPSRDFLAKFVDGGRKTPREGRSIAVPNAAKLTKSGILRKNQRPRALMSDPKVERIRLNSNREALVRFSGRGRGARVDVLYFLVRDVPIKPSFPIYKIARDTFDAHWQDAMRDGIMEEMLKTLARRNK